MSVYDESTVAKTCLVHRIPLVMREQGNLTWWTCPQCVTAASAPVIDLTRALADSLKAGDAERICPTDTERLDWWFAHGLSESVCEGSVDLWWAAAQDGDVFEVVTHGTSVRDALDKAMRGEFEA